MPTWIKVIGKKTVFMLRSFKGYSIGGDGGHRNEEEEWRYWSRRMNLSRWRMKKMAKPNIILFELVAELCRNEGWHVVGCYVLPSDKEGEARHCMNIALDAQPAGTRLLLLDDLNADLDCPWTT